MIVVILLGVIDYLWIYTPTTGPKISAYQAPKSALLVVDVQEDITGPASKMLDCSKSEPFISIVNKMGTPFMFI